MIAKCIAILAIVAQINASGCGCGQSAVLPSSGCGCQAAQMALTSSGCSSGPSSVTRNLIGKGKFPVALKSCGPNPSQQIPVTTSRFQAPVQERPVIRLPATIPGPKVVSHTCTCYKTIVRPRVHQQLITVPTIQRYIETTHKPVVENIQYEAVPVNCDSSSCGSSSCGSIELLSSGSSCGSSQSIQIPSTQTIQVPTCQTVQVPTCQSVQVPTCQSVQVPTCQSVQVPTCQTVQVPTCQTVQVPTCQSVQVPTCQTVQVPTCQTVQVPTCQSVQVPTCQNVQVPTCQSVQVPACQSAEVPQFSFGSSCSC